MSSELIPSPKTDLHPLYPNDSEDVEQFNTLKPVLEAAIMQHSKYGREPISIYLGAWQEKPSYHRYSNRTIEICVGLRNLPANLFLVWDSFKRHGHVEYVVDEVFSDTPQ